MKDIVIIGRGLAGATLSFQLINQGIKHRIIDKPSLSASSKVAAGLVNPIVLKRLKMVQGAELFMEHIPHFYKQIESITGKEFYHESSIQHIFANPGEINLWEEKKDISFHSSYLRDVVKNSYPNIIAPHGLGLMQNVGWLHTENYLYAHLDYCKANNVSIEERILTKTEVEKLYTQGSTVILSNGHLLKEWNILPSDIFTPTRGEVMTIKTDSLPTDSILHSSIFSIHLGSNLFKVGATYHWDNLVDQTSDEGLKKLKDDFEKVYSAPYTIINHQAGVRPNTKDRKPIIGQIKDNLYVFNGMGSRAALMTPMLSKLFVKNLMEHSELPLEYDIKRFIQN